jgi:hypothetical protein
MKEGDALVRVPPSCPSSDQSDGLAAGDSIGASDGEPTGVVSVDVGCGANVGSVLVVVLLHAPTSTAAPRTSKASRGFMGCLF